MLMNQSKFQNSTVGTQSFNSQIIIPQADSFRQNQQKRLSLGFTQSLQSEIVEFRDKSTESNNKIPRLSYQDNSSYN